MKTHHPLHMNFRPLGLLAAALAVLCSMTSLVAAPSPIPGTVRVFDQNNWRRECDSRGVFCDVVYFGTAKVMRLIFVLGHANYSKTTIRKIGQCMTFETARLQ